MASEAELRARLDAITADPRYWSDALLQHDARELSRQLAGEPSAAPGSDRDVENARSELEGEIARQMAAPDYWQNPRAQHQVYEAMRDLHPGTTNQTNYGPKAR